MPITDSEQENDNMSLDGFEVEETIESGNLVLSNWTNLTHLEIIDLHHINFKYS